MSSRNNEIEKLQVLMDNLDEDQLMPVMSIDGMLLVESGAGSGKTRVLTSRVYHMLLVGIKSSEILMLTFTNKAAKEMKERIYNLLGTDDSNYYELENLKCGTFHSIGIDILRDNIERLREVMDFKGIDSGFNILEEYDSLKLLKEIIKEKRLTYKEREVQEILSGSMNKLSRISDIVSSKESYNTVEDINNLIEIGKEYMSRKKLYNVLDYDDILHYWLLLLKRHEDVRKNLQSKYRYLLIDEYQDTNKIQDMIINYMSVGNVMVVGDVNQSIYSWRGAEIENIIAYRNIENGYKYGIGKNYRSKKSILKVAESIISNNQIKSEIEIEGMREDGEAVGIYRCRDRESECDLIVNTYIPSLIEKGVKLKDIAILYRTNEYVKDIEMGLLNSGYAYDLRTGKKFIERAHIRDMVSYLRVLNNIKDRFSLERCLFMQPGVGTKSVEKIIDCIYADGGITEGLESGLGKLGKKVGKFLNLYLSHLSSIQTESKSVSEILNEYFTEIYSPILEKEEEKVVGERVKDIERLIESSKSYLSVKEMIDKIVLSEEMYKELREGNLDDGGIILSSVHKSKGLEFDHVIIIGCNEGRFPNELCMGSTREIEEERRLMYVAVTRAKESLVFTYVERDYSFRLGGYVNYDVSRFLLEISEGLYNHYTFN